MRCEKIGDVRARILVCDDDNTTVMVIKSFLMKNGFCANGVHSGTECIKELQSNFYDILILDYLMPGMNADEVVLRIRQFNPRIYIMVLTGHAESVAPLETLRNLLIQDYLEKDGNFDKFLMRIESAMKTILYARNMLFNYTFKDMLVTFREIHNLSQEDLAQLINVHVNTIRNWEKGKHHPDDEEMVRLADVLNTSLDVLAGRLIHKKKLLPTNVC